MRGISDKATKIPLFLRVVSLYVASFIIIAFVFNVSTLGSKVNATPKKIGISTAVKKPPIVKRVIDGEPISLQIVRLGINLPIKNGVYDSATGKWTLSDDAVYYAQITTLPNNQRGNTFLYGHNDRNVFGPLSGLVVGDVAIIKTANNHIFTYIYSGDETIPPDLTSVLYANPDTPQLTMMTCEGVFSQARRLMYFDLQDAK